MKCRRTDIVVHTGWYYTKILSDDSKSIKPINELSKQFQTYIKKGHVNAALKLLTKNIKMECFRSTIKHYTIWKKYIQNRKMPTTIFTDRCSTEIHPLKFGGTDQEMIKKAAIKTKGRSGPSALEADRSWRILCSKNFADINVNLSKSNSKFYQGALHRKSVNCFFWSISCLLIHFSWYKPGFPIAVGEILGRITGKVIV